MGEGGAAAQREGVKGVIGTGRVARTCAEGQRQPASCTRAIQGQGRVDHGRRFTGSSEQGRASSRYIEGATAGARKRSELATCLKATSWQSNTRGRAVLSAERWCCLLVYHQPAVAAMSGAST